MAKQSLQARVEVYTGPITDTAALDHLLGDAAYELINRVPDATAERLAVTEDYATPEDASDKRVLKLTKSGRLVRQVPFEFSGDVTDSNSLYFATDEDPVWWYEIRKPTFYPSAGSYKMTYVPYPAISNESANIPNFPLEMEQLVILGAAIRVHLGRLNNARQNLPDPIDAPTLVFTPVTAETVPDHAKYTIDLASQFGLLLGYVSTDEDLELAAGKVNEIQAQLAEWTGEANIELQRAMANARIENDIAMFNATHELQVQIQMFAGQLQAFSAEVARYLQEMQAITQNIAALQAQWDRSYAIITGTLDNANNLVVTRRDR